MTAPPIYGVYSKDTTLIVMDEVLQGLRAGPARTWEQGVVNASSRLYELQRYGGIGDGTSHPLSERYATLAAAQVVYPFALALTEEIDTCAIRAAIASMPATGGTIRGGDGFVAMIDRQVILAKAKVKFAEAGFKFTAAPVLTSGTDLGMFFIGDGATDVQWEFVTFDAAGTAGGSLNNYFLWWQAGGLRASPAVGPTRTAPSYSRMAVMTARPSQARSSTAPARCLPRERERASRAASPPSRRTCPLS
jgi:hypothetical protein